ATARGHDDAAPAARGEFEHGPDQAEGGGLAGEAADHLRAPPPAPTFCLRAALNALNSLNPSEECSVERATQRLRPPSTRALKRRRIQAPACSGASYGGTRAPPAPTSRPPQIPPPLPAESGAPDRALCGIARP